MRRNLFFICALFLIISSSVLSQESTSNKDFYINNKSKAILFGIDKDIYLDSFIGTAFSAKKHFSSKRAFRVGLSLALNYENSKNSVESQISLDENHNKEKTFSYSITTSFEFLSYTNISNRVHFFWGIGPQVSYHSSNTKHYKKEDDLFEWEDEYTSDTYSFSTGLHTSIGIECFIARNVSILAEYGLTLYYEKIYINADYSSYERTYIDDNEYFRIQSSSKKLGLSFYFN